MSAIKPLLISLIFSVAHAKIGMQQRAESLVQTYESGISLTASDLAQISQLRPGDSKAYFSILLEARVRHLSKEEAAFLRSKAENIKFLAESSGLRRGARSEDYHISEKIDENGQRHVSVEEKDGDVSVVGFSGLSGYFLAFHELEHSLQNYRRRQAGPEFLRLEYRYGGNVNVTYWAEDAAMKAEWLFGHHVPAALRAEAWDNLVPKFKVAEIFRVVALNLQFTALSSMEHYISTQKAAGRYSLLAIKRSLSPDCNDALLSKSEALNVW